MQKSSLKYFDIIGQIYSTMGNGRTLCRKWISGNVQTKFIENSPSTLRAITHHKSAIKNNNIELLKLYNSKYVTKRYKYVVKSNHLVNFLFSE